MILMISIFIIGYLFIAFEHKVHINKAASALFLGVLLWVLYLIGVPMEERGEIVGGAMLEQLADVAEIILFLMGAMTIVQIIDSYDGFSIVTRRIKTNSSVKLLWIISFVTFVLSAILDNMTTAIIMVMILGRLIADKERKFMFACMVIFAANSGGAFSPIGDVTTIMLWIKGNITSLNTITGIFLPSLFSMFIPLIIISFMMKGKKEEIINHPNGANGVSTIDPREKTIVFWIGVIGLIMVPVLRSTTGLPPYMGIMAVLSILWIYTELLYRRKGEVKEYSKLRVSHLITHIDMPTILFFFGILMAVAALEERNILTMFANYLDDKLPNVYAITTLIGLLSAVVDNVPLVAGAMGMYPVVDPATLSTFADPAYMAHFMVDGHFWQLLAYCAGVGGSILIIGSAAGVVVMGIEKINFFTYLKKFSWIALLGYLSGVLVYYFQILIIG